MLSWTLINDVTDDQMTAAYFRNTAISKVEKDWMKIHQMNTLSLEEILPRILLGS